MRKQDKLKHSHLQNQNNWMESVLYRFRHKDFYKDRQIWFHKELNLDDNIWQLVYHHQKSHQDILIHIFLWFNEQNILMDRELHMSWQRCLHNKWEDKFPRIV